MKKCVKHQEYEHLLHQLYNTCVEHSQKRQLQWIELQYGLEDRFEMNEPNPRK